MYDCWNSSCCCTAETTQNILKQLSSDKKISGTSQKGGERQHSQVSPMAKLMVFWGHM